ncbi:stage II sporulation protein M, partial [Candidatus Woesearchaeota archaeon]|nr:stage II sporulation protein M [Candidatus Woesearchaeota archaeon]
MVLEQIYSTEFLRKKPFFAFLLGITYTLLGLGAAILMFPEDPALVAVAITSVLFLPSLYLLVVEEEEQESKERKFNLLKIIRRQKQFIKVYVYAFLGRFVVFSFFSMILPTLAANHLFREQLAILGSVGGAFFSKGLFYGILTNNLKIFLLCFLVSFILGNGAIFIIAWNGSVWGTIFGNLAKSSALSVGKNPFIYFVLILISVFPHMILEILAYILAIVAGTLISQGMLKEKFG